MATLYVTEFLKIGKDANGQFAQAASQLPLAEQTVTISASSAQSSAFSTQTALVRLVSDVNCCILFGTDPTATASKMLLVAYVPEYFVVPSGKSYKVAGINA
jgi:hypothetical protein